MIRQIDINQSMDALFPMEITWPRICVKFTILGRHMYTYNFLEAIDLFPCFQRFENNLPVFLRDLSVQIWRAPSPNQSCQVT
jgi:hypothetical protein